MDEIEVREMIDSATLMRSRLNATLEEGWRGDTGQRMRMIGARNALSTTVSALENLLPRNGDRGRGDN